MREAPRIDEFAFIARYLSPLAAGEAGALGLADDAATLAPAPGCEFVLTKDAMVAGVHFLPDDPPGAIARKLLRVNLSDLAAKGARPRAYLLALMLPPTIDEAWLAAFTRGLAADQAAYGVTLIGGDTTATPGPLALSLTAIGEVAIGRAIRRPGARAGDAIVVSGTIGDGALGLLAARGDLSGLSAAHLAELTRRYRLPEPRTTLGPLLIGLARAGLDVSDGLLGDLGHLCDTGGVGAAVAADRVPLSPAVAAVLAADPVRLELVLTGGDDYELLFAVPAERTGELAAVAAACGVPLTPIGRFEAAPGIRVHDRAGRALTFGRLGYTHF
ncbi:MAG: thiamine-phosphate kinase [Alphaproteobacteria bacterium]|nr:thiamine-phosphate kinase [Alphaproteobacteria bacterium]